MVSVLRRFCSHSVATALAPCSSHAMWQYYAVVGGKWTNKSPPAHLDMMAEMGWKRKQKEAKAAWEVWPASSRVLCVCVHPSVFEMWPLTACRCAQEAQAAGNADSADEDDEVSRMKNLSARLTG